MLFKDIRDRLLPDAVFGGDTTVDLRYIAGFSSDFSLSGGITFALKTKIQYEALEKCRADLVITDYPILGPIAAKCWISTSRARLQIARLTPLFSPPPSQPEREKYQNPDNTITTIGLSENVSIGKNVFIGDNTLIFPNVTIYDNTVIGDDCIIHANVVIGSDGFGFEPELDGQWSKINHLGKVAIGEKVEIGAGTCIDRGTFGDTLIGNNTKIDNQVHIAHNVRIGRNCQITAQTMIAGSCVIGDNAWLSPGCRLKEGIIIGANAFIGIGSVVTKDVEPGTRVAGFPARKI